MLSEEVSGGIRAAARLPPLLPIAIGTARRARGAYWRECSAYGQSERWQLRLGGAVGSRALTNSSGTTKRQCGEATPALGIPTRKPPRSSCFPATSDDFTEVFDAEKLNSHLTSQPNKLS